MRDRLTVLAEIAAKQQEIRRLTLELHQEERGQLEADLQAFLQEHPIVQAITWEQYTPYFNDGDTCTFSVGDATLHEALGDDGFPHDTLYEKRVIGQGRWGPNFVWDSRPNPNYTPLHDRAQSAFSEIWQAYSHDDFEAIFGDHKKVTVTRDGINVEDYTDHD